MKKVIGFVLCLLCSLSAAQQQAPLDGNWIKTSIEAYDRANIARTGSADDVTTSAIFLSYVGGMLAVHRQNNLMASLVVTGLDQQRKAARNATAAVEIDKQMRVAFVFTPLLAIPDTLSSQQVIAIVREYLESNPEKWGTAAPVLITDALQSAFSKK